MEALVMAGGKGTRMGGPVEKPLLKLAGKPMLSYVLDALVASRSITKISVAVSPDVPRTTEYVKNDERLTPVMTPGSGYIEDMGYALRALGLFEPVLIVAADLPLITPEVIDVVVDAYEKCGKEALSVRVEADIAPWQPDTVLTDTGSPTVPAGINVIHGAYMDREQEEHILIINDPALAANVNYRKDLTYCEHLLTGK
jgi:adenosylcobinamide-phosphate guanylyltransferase